MNKQIKPPAITQDQLKQILHYDPCTGIFTWLTTRGNGIKAGVRAGSVDNEKRYRYIGIQGRHHAEHRLAWLYMYGEWPQCQIDHKNKIRDDNRIENLRLAINNHADNTQNTLMHRDNSVGVKGVSKARNKFLARLCVDYKIIRVGLFDTLEEAARAYAEAVKKYHPFSAN